MESVRLERAVEADAAAIAALRLAAARELAGRFGPGPWSRASDTVGGVEQETRGGMTFLVRGDGGVVATLRLLQSNPWLGESDFFTRCRQPVYLTTMAVAPARQREGIGRACLAEAERIAREWGADAIRLDSYDAPAGAVGFYERCGFRAVRRGDYLGVRLVWLEKAFGEVRSSKAEVRI